ncbi:MAG: BirA family biotin operon repressor/biotin-[acetyl-CoA-carboxylase] ligase [Planctomycetota bacterium]
MTLLSNNLNLEHKILRINSCESTNTFAKELLSKSEPTEGTVIITDKQTKGRGQFGNIWLTEDYKNLTFSIILRPTFLIPSQQFYLSKITAIAGILTLNQITNQDFKIKWPNDIYFDNKKIGGILIENSITTNKIVDSVIGIGINVNQTFSNKNSNTTSLFAILNKQLNIDSVLFKYLMNIEKLYILLRKNNIKEINAIYKSKLLGINQKRKFIDTSSNIEITAKVKGVNNIGQLHLQSNGNDLFYNLKEIKWIF